MDDEFWNSHDAAPYAFQFTKTVGVDDECGWMQKKSWSLVENWGRNLRLKLLSSWAKLRECWDFQIWILGDCDSVMIRRGLGIYMDA